MTPQQTGANTDLARDQLSLLTDTIDSLQDAVARTDDLCEQQTPRFWGVREGPTTFMNRRRQDLATVTKALAQVIDTVQQVQQNVNLTVDRMEAISGEATTMLLESADDLEWPDFGFILPATTSDSGTSAPPGGGAAPPAANASPPAGGRGY